MNKVIFLFDLDSTVTTQEILPEIAKSINKEAEMRDLTEKTMMGELNFEESFTARVKLLSDIPVSQVSDFISNIGLEKSVINFINTHHDQCYIVTSNLDVWIEGLMKKIHMEGHYFCSNANVKDDKIINIAKILKKETAIKKLGGKIVAIGDGSNDYNLLKNADISIAFGGVRNIAPCLFEVANYAIYDGAKLEEFLLRLV